MDRKTFGTLLKEQVLFLDGATGSNLYAAGMPSGICAETWILDHKEVMIDLQQGYLEAGSDVIYAPTFSCNQISLKKYGKQGEVKDLCHKLVGLSKEAVSLYQPDRKVLIAGDLMMTGELLEPFGDLEYKTLVKAYKEQASILKEEGVDLFVVETMMSLEECEAAAEAIRSVSDLPLCISLTFETAGKTLYGADAKDAVSRLFAAGADVVGANCSGGPKEMLATIQIMQEEAKGRPLLAKPNAGLPKMKDGQAIYEMTKEEFAEQASKLLDYGVRCIGGCCGTTKDHILALINKIEGGKSER